MAYDPNLGFDPGDDAHPPPRSSIFPAAGAPPPPSNIAPGVDAYRAAHPNDLTQGERGVGNAAGDLNGGVHTAINAIGKGATDAWNWIQPKPIDPLAPVTQYPGYFDPNVNRGLAGQQQANISDLAAAAAGQVASPAEIQLQKASGLNAARQFGLASALQGRDPGAAMRSARLGSISTQAGTNIDAAMLRAKEQQDARQALVEALARARQQEQGLYTTDVDYRKGMLDATAKNAAAENQFKGSLINGGGGIASAIFSDRRMKRAVRPANLRKLAAVLKGYNFRYKDPAYGEGERVGVMAQDVEKGGAAGKLIVRRGADRKLRLDVGNAVGAALAMSAEALRASQKAA